ENDIIKDAATGQYGVDLDGDGLIEIDLTRSGFLSVDFNNDGQPDDVIADQNGDGIPEIDLSRDGLIEFGYLPEKWTKETSRLFGRWAKIRTAVVQEYQIGLGYNNMSNGVTQPQVGGSGWMSAGTENSLELSNLPLLATKITSIKEDLPVDRNAPFDLG